VHAAKQLRYLRPSQPIERPAVAARRCHHAAHAQDPELLADDCLRRIEPIGDTADVQRSVVEQRRDAQAQWVTQGPQEVGDSVGLYAFEQHSDLAMSLCKRDTSAIVAQSHEAQ
jgi:hypothetical protein